MKCPNCGSEKVSRNGRRQNRQNYICKDCGRQFLEAKISRGYSLEVRQICIRMREQGLSFRQIERLTGVSHNTIIGWVQRSQASLEESDDEASCSEIYLDFSEGCASLTP